MCLLGAADPQKVPGLAAEHLYNGVDRPALIEVVSPRSFGMVTLVLMNFDGGLLAPPVDVMPGRVDLAETLPAIWDLRRAAYLQMLDGTQPVGSSLVLQPMLSRMVPVTRSEPHPMTGQPHSRIVDWVDENTPPLEAPAATQPATAPESGNAADKAGQDPAAGETRDPPRAVERLFTGLRIYPERDVILHTTAGDIRLAMRHDEAPNTAWNFLTLCAGGFYRDVAFHRVVKLDRAGRPFVIQAGDPTGTGDGGPGYWLPIEDSHLPHDFGVISMARSDDPDSNGSQFFIGLSREGTARLDGQYCAFGYAVDGAAAILTIADVALADIAAGRPVEPPLIKSTELVPAPPRTPGPGPRMGRPDQRITPESRPTQPRPTRVPR
jgi:peptidyl-prolyl cis-trans isomerase B (cyclophilin B)